MAHTIIRIQRRNQDISQKAKNAGLFMSATLNPPSAAVARAKPEDRLNDYLEALRFYLSLPNKAIDRILFVDNSNSDLSPLAKLAEGFSHEKDVELISFNGNDHPYQRGKAYGEFKLMDYGLENTTLFAPGDIVWKTTGRLKFLNLTEMIESSRRLDFDVLCDLRNVPWIGSGKWKNHENMELRVFAFRLDAYDKVFRGLWKNKVSDFDAEFMYHTMRQNPADQKIVPRFPLQPRLQGISGRHQRDYQSTSQRTKDAVRGTMRQIVPWLWL